MPNASLIPSEGAFLGLGPEERVVALREQIAQLVRSPEFRGADTPTQLSQFRAAMSVMTPGYATLPLVEQNDVAQRSIEHFSPSLSETITSFIPVVGALGRTTGAALRQENLPGASALEAIFGPAPTVNEVPALLQRAEQIPGLEGITQVPLGRAALNLVGDYALFRSATSIGARVAPRLPYFKQFFAASAGPGVRALSGQATLTAARAGARGAAGELLKREIGQIGSRALTDGFLFSVGHSALSEERPTLSGITESVLGMAALGGLFMGAGRAIRRFGEARVSLAAPLMGQPVISNNAPAARSLVSAYAKRYRVDAGEAGESLFDLVRGGQADARAWAELLKADPRLLSSELGEHLLIQLRPTLAPRVEVALGDRIRVTYEEGFRTKTEDLSREEFKALEERGQRGEVNLREVRGPEDTLFALREAVADVQPLPVADPTGPITDPVGGATQAAAPTPTPEELALYRALSVQPSAVEARAIGGPPRPRPSLSPIGFPIPTRGDPLRISGATQQASFISLDPRGAIVQQGQWPQIAAMLSDRSIAAIPFAAPREPRVALPTSIVASKPELIADANGALWLARPTGEHWTLTRGAHSVTLRAEVLSDALERGGLAVGKTGLEGLSETQLRDYWLPRGPVPATLRAHALERAWRVRLESVRRAAALDPTPELLDKLAVLVDAEAQRTPGGISVTFKRVC